jgi:hypothetical protein
MNAVHIRGIKPYKFVERIIALWIKLICQQNIESSRETAKVFKQKEQGRSERLKLIMLMVHPIIKLRCLRRRITQQQNYTTGKIIAIMDAGFLG